MTRARKFAAERIAIATAAYVERTWRAHHRRARPLRLAQRVAVSLTSYPPRFPTLALTLKSLLAQSTRPDRIDLWIARGDRDVLPDEVLRLQSYGIAIRTCDDLRSYKKLVPALVAGVRESIVIADDDVYYPHEWLRELTHAHRAGRNEVTCTRAHRMRLGQDGLPLPYAQWDFAVVSAEPSHLLFPTGIGGVLYEPGIFHADVTRSEIFGRLCPAADDVWFYWMAALNGARFRAAGPRRRWITWARSQQVALSTVNHTGNDEQIRNMIDRYGLPFAREQLGIGATR